MRKVDVETFEVRMYVGGREGYDGPTFDADRLRAIIKTQQGDDQRALIPLRLTPTQFLEGDYVEDGWEIAAINHPRHPKTMTQIYKFMEGLARHLMVTLVQKRIVLTTPSTTIMIEDNTMPA